MANPERGTIPLSGNTGDKTHLTLLVDNTGDQAGFVSLDSTGDKTDLMPGENPNLKEQEFENPWKLHVSEAFLGEKLLSRAP